MSLDSAKTELRINIAPSSDGERWGWYFSANGKDEYNGAASSKRKAVRAGRKFALKYAKDQCVLVTEIRELAL